jgi:hypothetical protein
MIPKILCMPNSINIEALQYMQSYLKIGIGKLQLNYLFKRKILHQALHSFS